MISSVVSGSATQINQILDKPLYSTWQHNTSCNENWLSVEWRLKSWVALNWVEIWATAFL